MNSTDYYCHECSRSIYQPINILDINLTGSLDGYQLDKFIKHTIAIPMMGYTSSFINHSYQNYSDYTVRTLASGSLEVITKGSKTEYNYVFIASKKIGELSFNGSYLSDEDGIKVVLSNNPDKLHSYTTGSFGLREAVCKNCGNKIFI